MRLSNGWTGGQYSIFRAIFGTYLLVHFVQLLPWGAELFSSAGVLPQDESPLFRLFPNVLLITDAPWMVSSLLVLGCVASAAFALGWRDRIAAVVLWYLLACLVGRNPLILNPSLPFVGWLLLAHAVLPTAPFGSIDARGRVDPRGGWRMPPSIFAAAWIVMSVAYSYSGWTKLVSPSWTDGTAMARVLENPLARDSFLRDGVLALPSTLFVVATFVALGLELFFVLLALSRRLRPWLWLAMISMHLGLIALIDFADLSLGMVMVHLFTFNPDWVPARGEGRDQVYYDGSCGLCHGAVRWLLAEDRRDVFDFAPLESEQFSRVAARSTSGLPDSVVLETASGEILVKSGAVVHLLSRLGGMWRVIGWLARVIPLPVREFLYDVVARIRYKLFTRPADACPILPPDLRHRVS